MKKVIVTSIFLFLTFNNSVEGYWDCTGSPQACEEYFARISREACEAGNWSSCTSASKRECGDVSISDNILLLNTNDLFDAFDQTTGAKWFD